MKHWVTKIRCISRSTEQLSAHCEGLFSVGLGKILFQIRRELTAPHCANWQGNRSSIIREIPHVFVYYGLQTRARVVPILSLRNPVYILPCYHKIGFISTFLSTSRSSKRSFFSTFPRKNPVFVCILTMRGTCPAHIVILVLNTSVTSEQE